jgi:ubiquinone/menaquinone biosynthesis C-methylase UbiE
VTNALEVVTKNQSQLAHWFKEIYRYLQYDQREGTLQLNHRIALVNLWSPKPGGHILEIGCGQGETTVVLAVAVGPSGRVLAVDRSAAAYGAPVTLDESHAHLKSSRIGDRIAFWLSTDLLAPQLDFPKEMFDLVIFSHSSWYMSSAQQLYRLFARVRPWAKRLGFAEWDIRSRCMRQVPHMLAALLQARVQRLCPQVLDANIRSVILPEEARSLAEKAGWTILQEEVMDTSTQLGYGRSWEIHHALELVERLIDSDRHGVTQDIKDTLFVEMQLLQRLSDASHNLSLSTYAFLAQ